MKEQFNIVMDIGEQMLVSGAEVHIFFVSLSLSIYAEIMARIIKTPITTFIITSLIPLVPGSSLIIQW